MNTQFVYNDGGRSAYYKGKGGDCVTRAIAIVTGRDYKEVYDILAEGNSTQRKGKREGSKAGKRTALSGINTKRKWFQDYMKSLGFTWIPTMQIGQGCKTHLRSDELPQGRIIVSVSKHYTAMIDGVINDTYDPSRNGNRCVYGYWIKK
jgi:lipoprotein-anchoring transpeptidase ErfK/SrfK